MSVTVIAEDLVRKSYTAEEIHRQRYISLP